ncbi:MAG: ATP-grasp domain-containing protein [Candidatus Aminicenantes bacterium]
MKIAFTHNIQLTISEEEAEFDRPETVSTITQALRDLGHTVEPIDVAGPASRLVARLEALNPDLVFNTAEGSKGRFREAFYPALFDRLSLPFTGSDAYVCALTLDKNLTKMVLTSQGIPTPRWIFINDLAAFDPGQTIPLRFPLMVKPNFEGSSMGITIESVVENPDELRTRVEYLLSRYPAGILIEEFIVGRDLVVPFLEKASAKTGGVLEPAVYHYDEKYASKRKYLFYDFEMKTTGFNHLLVKVPADISSEQREEVIFFSKKVFKALDIHDLGRIDFRMGEDGKIYFIEINALPSLEAGASLYKSGALAGLDTTEKVLQAVLSSAAERYGLNIPSVRPIRRKSQIRIGLIYNLKRPESTAQRITDAEAEFDKPETIAAIRRAIESYGHEVVKLEATPELSSILPSSGIDVAFNVAKGLRGRTRESQVPALLDLLGIPYTGSDPTTLSIALDKGLAKRLVAEAGLINPPFVLMTTGKERLPRNLYFPVIVKPVAEGSSKGIIETNVVETEEELRKLVTEISARYMQAVIVESYLPGREFTVGLLGEKRPKVLPVMEVLFTDHTQKYPVYSFDNRFVEDQIKYEVPANIESSLMSELERTARSVFSILGCRDIARIDLRLDKKGRINFMECNPLPSLIPGYSDFCLIAEAAGMNYRSLIGEILAPALRRLREKSKERLLAMG